MIFYCKENYYDLKHNRVTIGGLVDSDNVVEAMKVLSFPSVLPNLYGISSLGRVYSFINDSYISWSVRDGLPYVTLSCYSDRGRYLEPIYIKDLVAYNYIEDSSSYLERGYHAFNVDGDPMNCNYLNIRYINPTIWDTDLNR